MKILLDEHKLNTVFVNVTVRDGNVRLGAWSKTPTRPRRQAAATKNLPGVKSVENNLGPGPMSGVPV